MTSDAITFGLAFAAYLSLCADVVTRRARRPRRSLAPLTAVVATTHVILVWSTRFHWSLADAWSKSPLGFVLFHGTLALLLVSAVRSPDRGDRGVFAAFVIVSAAAVPAPWRYPEIAILRAPMVVTCAVTAVLALGVARRRRFDEKR